MKKLIFFFFVFSFFGAAGQPFQNSWINYSQPYYKFSVGKDGLYWIPYALLQTAGLQNVPAEQFQLWRNGKEQPLYISKTTGPLSTGDFIEFFGLKNDGKPDTKLYRQEDFQLSDHYSLFTDTASYFLTVHTGNNLRLVNDNNNVAGNSLPVEKYFMNKLGYYFNNYMNPGYSRPVGGVYLYSSSFDQAEGWTSPFIGPGGDGRMGGISGMNMYVAGPDATLTYAAAGSAFNNRDLKITLKNSFYTGVVASDPMPSFNYLKKSITIPLSAISKNPNWLQVFFGNTSTVSTDRMVASFFELTYPSTFNFNNQTFFYFELPPSSVGNYLEITNFNKGIATPVLYDYTTGKRYVADMGVANKYRFVLPPSTDTQRLRMISRDPAALGIINNLQQRNFVDYSQPANQGNYIIISNPLLYNSSTGNNYVEEYRQYRSSAQGGSFKAIVVDINDLEDQFAYGISKHPLSIKDFIQFANANFNPKPQYVFIIGKGTTYDEYMANKNSPYKYQLNLVPTFGSPASDNLLSSSYGITTPSVPIGRLSVISGDEVGNYLDKMKTYEGAQQSASNTIDDKLWMKNVVQTIGGADSSEDATFRNYMYGYKFLLEDSLLGDHVETFSKGSNAAIELASGKRIEQLFEQGFGLLCYFGHSSASALAYNLSDPQAYNNPNKYPFFFVSGCTAGNNFTYDTLRLVFDKATISENFVVSKNRGSIGFLASTHYGIPPYLDEYNQKFFSLLRSQNYGMPVGNIIRNTIKALDGDDPGIDFYSRADLEEMGLNGDPALRINAQPKPDYVIEDNLIKIDPAFISVSQEKFTLGVKAYNLGKAVRDSIYLDIKRTYPDGTVKTILHQKILAPYYADSIQLYIPIISSNDKGLNKITATIDAGNNVDEMSETNNSATKEFFIFEDEARPAYPANFAIINTNNQKLYASTANPVSNPKDYIFQIDTTQLFNSTLKISKTINSKGGVIEFDPGIIYQDSTVYYWRVAVKSDTTSPENYRWNNSSFIYLANSSLGSNQSHYYQHLYSDTTSITMDSARQWKFGLSTGFLHAKTGVYPTAASAMSDFSNEINGTSFVKNVCGISGIIVNVIDPITLKPWYNTLSVGRFGSDPVCGPERMANFQYTILSQEKRTALYHFLKDSIPAGSFVIVRNISGVDPASNTYASDWMGDTTLLGPGNSLYHELFNEGFTMVDSFTRPRAFIFMFQKENTDFVPTFVFSKGISDPVALQHEFKSPDSLGYITSPIFGPAIHWKQLHWRGTDDHNPPSDNPTVDIIGVDNNGNETVLMTAEKDQNDLDISSVNSGAYPYIRLRMRNSDTLYTPFQLKYWRVNYDPAPEGALAPSVLFKAKDTLTQGEPLDFEIAFKNISPEAFDSMKIKVTVLDAQNVTHIINIPRQKPLISGDTISVKLSLDTRQYPGANILYVDFNPDNDQAEQYHYNNFIYHDFFVKTDFINPLMDVTFDGVHILNRDIVSSKPHILIKLKDESKFLRLTDTSLVKVQVRYPDGTLKNFNFNSDTLRFTPAGANDNTATIDFNPAFFSADNLFELIVSGKDEVGNLAGTLDYHVTFRIIGKPMISNMLNYPNPFTTSTAFVFTITGSEVPQNIRIQILTITGKIVREITKDELGPLHIGRNITDFKWDGTDMYGQKLANGVYLYRVLTNLNGKSLDKFTDDGDKTDEYFNKGYGKMYLMR